jgi:hypothetical protein
MATESVGVSGCVSEYTKVERIAEIDRVIYEVRRMIVDEEYYPSDLRNYPILTKLNTYLEKLNAMKKELA